ncbi:GGDEF-domain containing protein [Labrys miyagiensis]|uniref:GGDEF-domain containing protein n=1 Tax=Labrys miyagiensis TaxID=346912 RepID=A0ABQ6CU52_9HYPH|nr:EAL domain-containing protein [Labrys miyagiensis]GLS22259.1 GGDEF-domain containing protein [Labrys miyagiensis]
MRAGDVADGGLVPPEFLENTRELVSIYDRELTLTQCAARLKTLRGDRMSIGASLFDIYPDFATGDARKALDRALFAKAPAILNLATASRREVEVRVFPTAAGIGLIESAEVAMAPAEADHSELLHQATHDVLTGLQNRQRLSDRLKEILATRNGMRERSALLQIDLDDFKSVNDTLGHGTGDALLKLAANRIRGVLQEGDSAYRYAGDEFAIIQYGKDPSEAESVAHALVDAFKVPFIINEMPLFVGASVGIAFGPQHGGQGEELMKAADIALYAAKGDGRGCARVFNRSMLLLIEQRENLRRSLRLALERQELLLEYQPLLRSSGQVVGFEALVRWDHPEVGRITPNVFIPIAEADGLMEEIGRWVLEEACRQAMTWPDSLSIAVNLSPAQFLSGTLTDVVAQVIDSTGIRADRIELEITESVLLEETVDNLDTLNTLNVLGIRISLDDFGTRYSSLSYLKNFPFDSLKIDRYFIQDVERERKSQTIVRTIIGMAHGLDMIVTAEGVETAPQAQWLINEGCDLLQGLHLGQVMSAEKARMYASKAGTSRRRRERIN